MKLVIEYEDGIQYFIDIDNEKHLSEPEILQDFMRHDLSEHFIMAYKFISDEYSGKSRYSVILNTAKIGAVWLSNNC